MNFQDYYDQFAEDYAMDILTDEMVNRGMHMGKNNKQQRRLMNLRVKQILKEINNGLLDEDGNNLKQRFINEANQKLIENFGVGADMTNVANTVIPQIKNKSNPFSRVIQGALKAGRDFLTNRRRNNAQVLAGID
jgi:hypothetical protein